MGKNLCETCSYYSSAKIGNNEVRVCRVFEAKLTQPVSVCTDYIDKGSMGLSRMESIALYVERPKDKVGFIWVSKKDRKDFDF